MATKKSTSKKAPTKKKSTVKRSKTQSSSALGTVRLQPETKPFMTFQLTKETIYWVVLGAVVILFTIWLMRLQMDIQSLYDDIDASNMSSETIKP